MVIWYPTVTIKYVCIFQMLLSGLIKEQFSCLVVFLMALDLQKFLFNIIVLTMLLTISWSLLGNILPSSRFILTVCTSFWMHFHNKPERLMFLKCRTVQTPLEEPSEVHWD